MNYIQELNAFYEWLDSNPMPASAISLWHTLMQINNRGRWTSQFTVAISTLVSKTGSQRSAVFASRKLLIAKGRIKCATNGSSYAATYSLIPFSAEAEKQPPESDKVHPKSADEQTSHRTDAVPINKQKETKQNSNQEPKGSLSSSDDGPAQIIEIFNDYNRICKNLPAARILTNKRRETIGARLHEVGRETILTMLEKAANSKFLAGQNDRLWVASFDWVFKPGNFAKILEGKYDRQHNSFHPDKIFVGKPSPLELIEEAYNGIMDQQDEY